MSKKSSKSPSSPVVYVPLKFHLPEAVAVNVAGSFNDWDPASLPMTRTGDGYWILDLSLPPGLHEFRLIIDGIWSDAPGVTDSAENVHGSRNAVLNVPPPIVK